MPSAGIRTGCTHDLGRNRAGSNHCRSEGFRLVRTIRLAIAINRFRVWLSVADDRTDGAVPTGDPRCRNGTNRREDRRQSELPASSPHVDVARLSALRLRLLDQQRRENNAAFPHVLGDDRKPISNGVPSARAPGDRPRWEFRGCSAVRTRYVFSPRDRGAVTQSMGSRTRNRARRVIKPGAAGDARVVDRENPMRVRRSLRRQTQLQRNVDSKAEDGDRSSPTTPRVGLSRGRRGTAPPLTTAATAPRGFPARGRR
jgi:hypothetical protein